MFAGFLAGLRQFVIEFGPSGRIFLQVLLHANHARGPGRGTLHLRDVEVELTIRFF